ncbi:uncharacterized protein LOC114323027 [Camellia sinensis]|uniref:uncharacterized protein LOC114323027 n=1 Tax=Camellia sinensis TaxID=4442 RepID=UPI001035CBC7|nr:uncharacterized protein LOC114323027 [Camellia sinensis]
MNKCDDQFGKQDAKEQEIECLVVGDAVVSKPGETKSFGEEKISTFSMFETNASVPKIEKTEKQDAEAQASNDLILQDAFLKPWWTDMDGRFCIDGRFWMLFFTDIEVDEDVEQEDKPGVRNLQHLCVLQEAKQSRIEKNLHQVLSSRERKKKIYIYIYIYLANHKPEGVVGVIPGGGPDHFSIPICYVWIFLIFNFLFLNLTLLLLLLQLCSITLATGLFICLRSATKITHRAQIVSCLAAKWHVCATVDSFDDLDDETETLTAQISSSPPLICPISNGNSSCHHQQSDHEEEDGDGEEDDLDNTKMVPISAHTISYQKRQALVTYFENNRAGITVFGFMLDRTWLHTIFVIELSLTLWLLNKTIGIS